MSSDPSTTIDDEASAWKSDDLDKTTSNKADNNPGKDHPREESDPSANLPVKKRKIELSSHEKQFEIDDDSDSGERS
jgi:hypothetical protein